MYIVYNMSTYYTIAIHKHNYVHTYVRIKFKKFCSLGQCTAVSCDHCLQSHQIFIIGLFSSCDPFTRAIVKIFLVLECCLYETQLCFVNRVS